MANTKELYANNARTTLAGSLSNIATSIVLQTGAGALFPSPNNSIGEFAKATLQDTATGLRNEIVYITARTGDVLTVTRAQDGTSAQTWSAGDTVFEGVTAATLANFAQPVDIQNNAYTYADASGSTTAYTATYSPAVAALVNGMQLNVNIGSIGTNTTTTPTFSPDGLAAHTITKNNGVALAVGDMPNQCILRYQLSTTSWILINPLSSGRLISVQVFNTAGTSTYTPTAGTTSVIVKGIGGGAAGGGTAATSTGQVAVGGGGGSGSIGEARFTSSFSGVTVTIGAGGTGTAGGNGGNGGTSSFGALLSLPGGQGGAVGTATTGSFVLGNAGGGGAVSTGGNIFNGYGNSGQSGIVYSPATLVVTGRGADSPYGQGGDNYNSAGLTSPGKGYGSGGSSISAGQLTAAQAGGAGKNGIIIVYEYA